MAKAKTAAAAREPAMPEMEATAKPPRSFRPLEPADFAPFAEPDLLEFALRLARAHPEARATTLAQSVIGATLLSISGDLDNVIAPLLDIWGPEGVVVREGLDLD